MALHFNIITNYDDLLFYLPEFLPLTLDYFIENFKGRYLLNPKYWENWARVHHGISFKEILDRYRYQKENQIFPESLQQRYRDGYGTGMWTVLLFNNNHLIGTARITKRDNNICELHSVYVDPASRGHGWGKELVKKCITTATSLKFHSIQLTTYPYMKAAIGVYESLGFIKSKYLPFDDISSEDLKKTKMIFMELVI